MVVRSFSSFSAVIPIPRDMDKASWKVLITRSNGTVEDVTSYMPSMDVERIATSGVSNFTLILDNNEGRYVNIFNTGDIVDLYYNFDTKANLTTIKLRSYIDSVYDSMSLDKGFEKIVVGRDAPKSSTNEHFVDSKIDLSFTGRNNLDCWYGVESDQDSLGNYEDGVLYNSGLKLQVYDTSDNTWKVYDDLTTAQKTTLKLQTGYTQTHTDTYIDQSRLTISKRLASEGDYEFRIYYDSGADISYLRVHPENGLNNDSEVISLGQNLISVGRFGKDTSTEYNRVKEVGSTDGSIISMRTKSDSARQNAVWIKDKVETVSSSADNNTLVARASSRLTELKEAIAKGAFEVCMIPTLQPGERVRAVIPYIINDYVKIKTYSISISNDIVFNLNIQDRETTFDRLFKDRIDETTNISILDNPHGLSDAIVYDFSDVSEFTLTDCEVNDDNILVLSTGESTGKALFPTVTADIDITKFVLRAIGYSIGACIYEVSNDNTNFYPVNLGVLYTMVTTGKALRFRITLNQTANGESPGFEKINNIYK